MAELRPIFQNIANAIREKNGLTDTYTPEQMPQAIQSLKVGSGSEKVEDLIKKDVNFCDYDGTCLYAYTLKEAQALSELPALPSPHEGLVCQGWNWTLEQVKALDRRADIGINYTTDNGAYRIYLSLDREDALCIALGLYLRGEVDIDWGDGIVEHYGADSTDNTYYKHTYLKVGKYTISLQLKTGQCWISKDYVDTTPSVTQTYSLLIVDGNGVNGHRLTSQNVQKWSKTFYLRGCIKKIERNGKILDMNRGLSGLYNLETITTDSQSSNSSTFWNCEKLKFYSFSLNSIATTMEGYFYNCHDLTGVSLTPGMGLLGTIQQKPIFRKCHKLKFVYQTDRYPGTEGAFDAIEKMDKIEVPKTASYIQAKWFQRCSPRFYDFTRCVKVPGLNASGSLNLDYPYSKENNLIIVPDNLLSQWKSATNWSELSICIVNVEEAKQYGY